MGCTWVDAEQRASHAHADGMEGRRRRSNEIRPYVQVGYETRT